MSNEQVAPETKGVTVQLLATIDLGPEIEGMAATAPVACVKLAAFMRSSSSL